MKRLRLVGLSLFLLLGMLAGGMSVPAFSGEADAATVTTYTTTANLNLRKSASTSSSVLLTIPKGKKVTYISKTGSWYKVKYSSKTGFVSSKYVKKTTTTTTASTTMTATKFQTTANVNMRLKASTSGSVLVTIPKGKVVTATAKSGSWYKVKYASKTGWIKSTYVKEYYQYTTTSKTLYKTTKTASLRSTADTKKAQVYSIPADNTFESTQKVVNSKGETWYRVTYKSKNYYVKSTEVTKVTASSFSKLTYKAKVNTTLYSYAGAKHTALTTVSKGATITTTYKIGNWYKTTYNGKTGYVLISNFSKVTTSSTSTNMAETKFQTTANVNMRSKASTSSSVLATIPKGKVVTATAKSGSWYKVKYSSKTGWVSSAYVKEYYQYATTSTTLYKTTKTASLRSTPDTKKAQAYSIPADNTFESTQKVVNSTGETWYRVAYKSKNYYVKSTEVTKVTASSFSKLTYKANVNTTLYSYAGAKHTALLTVPKGATITTTYKIGNWYKTTYNGKTGYVLISNFSKVTSSSGSTSGSESTSGSTTTTPSELPSGTAITKVNYVTTSNLSLRASDTTSSTLLVTIPEGTTVSTSYKTSNSWFQVTYNGKTGFVSGDYLITEANAEKMKSYESNQNSYLFLDLRKKSSVTATQIDNYIAKSATSSNSVLYGQGATIIAAAEKYGVNALYLAAHAIHESNYGKSTISMAKNNLFGFGAYDLAPFVGAVKFSTVKSNIEFIAQEMKATYLNPSNWKYKGAYLGYTVKNVNGTRIDSLSKGMNFYYASDSNWGNAIASHMSKILSYSNEGAKNQTANTTVPSRPSYPSGKDVFPTGTLAVANASISLYSTKGGTTVAATIPKGVTFNLLEKWNDYWLTVKYNGKTYYTNKISLSSYHNYMTVKNLARVTATSLNVRSSASTAGSVVGTLSNYEYVELVVNSSNNPVTNNGWYQVKLDNGKTGWCSGTYLYRELNK